MIRLFLDEDVPEAVAVSSVFLLRIHRPSVFSSCPQTVSDSKVQVSSHVPSNMAEHWDQDH